MKNFIVVNLLLFSFLFQAVAMTNEEEKFISVVKDELKRNMDVLSKQEIPVYYIGFRITDEKSTAMNYTSGAEFVKNIVPVKRLNISMRVGSKEKDNTHLSGSAINFITTIPYEFNEKALRFTIWSAIDQLYKNSKTSYQQMLTTLATKTIDQEKANDFSDEEVSNYYEEPNNFDLKTYDITPIKDIINEINTIINSNDDIINNNLSCSISNEREIFLDTNGSFVCQNHQFLQIIASVQARCDDGMIVQQYRSFCSPDLSLIPEKSEVIKQIKEMSDNISKTKRAPLADSYSGPIMLSGQASGVFFHEFLGHRIEATRMKSSSDGQTFKKKLGQEVLSNKISVVFDPNINTFNGRPLIGGYAYDNEGVKGQRVEVIKDGILNGFLTNRSPIEGFPKSNGHGRGQSSRISVARQSNMFISSPNAKNEKELRNDFIKLLKESNKEYGYLIKEISGGITQTSTYATNSFNINPLLTYRVYVDGREDEIVRGLNIIGTPLNAMSKIHSCGDDYEIFNGVCGAESGSVLVSAVSPSIVVSSMETQKTINQNVRERILEAPKNDSAVLFDNDPVLSAMKKEVDRALTIKNDNPKYNPFFVSCYTQEEVLSIPTISANAGTIFTDNTVYDTPIKCNIRILLNNNHETQELGNNTPNSVIGKYYPLTEAINNLPSENNELALRKEIWKLIDNTYFESISAFNSKTNELSNNKMPEEYEGLDDFETNDKKPKVVLQNNNVKVDKELLKDFVIKASIILEDKCKDKNLSFMVSSAGVSFRTIAERIYTSEGNTSKVYSNKGILSLSIYGFDKEGKTIRDNYRIFFDNPLNPISDKELNDECEKAATLTALKVNPETDNKSYFGPILLRGNYAAIFSRIFQNPSNTLSILNRPKTNGNVSAPQMLTMKDRKVISKYLSMHSLVGSEKINGKTNINYSPIDMEGTETPADLVLIDKGILKNLMKGRTPLPDFPNSTGQFFKNMTIKITSEKCISKSKLKKKLLSLAKEETLPYAYIIDFGEGVNYDATNNDLKIFRVDLKSGEETFVEGVTFNNSNENLRLLRNVFGTSDNYKTYYLEGQVNKTYIIPDEILLEDVDLSRAGKSNKSPKIVPQWGL